MLETLSFSLKNLLLPGVMTLIIGFLCNLVRLYIQQIRDVRLRRFLQQLVEAAEQIYGPGQGAAKYEYVVRQAQRQGHPVNRADIEAAVFRTNSRSKGVV